MQGTSRPDRELLDAAALRRHLVPVGSVHAFLAEHRHRLFPDELFADLFGSGRGRPSVPADVVATVMVLQDLLAEANRPDRHLVARTMAPSIASRCSGPSFRQGHLGGHRPITNAPRRGEGPRTLRTMARQSRQWSTRPRSAVMMWWKDSWGSATVTGTPVISRRRALWLAFVGSVGAAAALAGCGSDPASTPDSGTVTSRDDATGNGGVAVLIYASPTCGCCGDYADYLEAMGYPVDLRRTDQVDAIKADAGVPDVAASCHTAMIDDYVVEGHVPAEAIELLLEQRPTVDGIALPGMPPGSPGMGGTKAAPFEILSFVNGTVEPFTTL